MNKKPNPRYGGSNLPLANRKKIGVQKNPKSPGAPSPQKVGTSVTVKQKRTDTPVMDSDDDDEDEGVVNIDPAKNCSNTTHQITSSDDDIHVSEVDSPGENSSIQIVENITKGNKRPASQMGKNIDGNPGTVEDTNQNSQTNPSPETPSCSGSGLKRRKRKITYYEEDWNTLDHEMYDEVERKKRVCDIFSFPLAHISKMTRQPKLVEHYVKAKIFILDDGSSSKFQNVGKFFSKCGPQFDDLYVSMCVADENFRFFKGVLQHFKDLVRLSYRYEHGQEVLQLLAALKVHKEKGNLQALTCFKLVGNSGNESLRNDHLLKLSEVGIKFQSLELGDSLWEDVEPSSLEKLLGTCKSTLDTLIIYGGFRGSGDKAHRILTFPQMEVLSTLLICPYYGFLSEFKDPVSKKSRIAHLSNDQEEPFKFTVQFKDSFPNLKYLVLGSLIELEDLSFSMVRKLIEFRCGSFWNLSLNFPHPSSRISLRQSKVDVFQFPDGLKDPSLVEKLAKYFPHLKNVHLYLPSVPVLQAFFKAFANSGVVTLNLKTQFDFESTLESCLLPGSIQVKGVDEKTKTLIEKLKGYKHFEDYANHYNLQLPVVHEDEEERTNYPGITGLKQLMILQLEHIPRKLLIPVKNEEKRWDDINCKFLTTTFGFEKYPLSYKCDHEILKNVMGYCPENIQISEGPRVSSNTRSGGLLNEDREGEEVCFIPVKSKVGGRSSGVKYLPSMLLPEVNIKSESDDE